jgi:AcrR family transcriptional regulator
MRLPEDRAQMLIDAAAGEFLSRGFRHGGIESISRMTGIGKATIYRHFTDKNGLFSATVMRIIETLARPSFDFSQRTDSIETVLFDFAQRAIGLFLRDRNLALHRMVIETSHLFPDLARAVHARSTEWSLDTLKPYLDRMAANGTIDVVDTDWAARQFLNVATHGILYLMSPAPADEATRRALAEETVALFLGGAPAMTVQI